jgi:hypothetical protein
VQDWYCSPEGCSTCTDKGRESAVKEVELLVAVMGQDWTYRVWCNLGWHWQLHSPDERIRVWPHKYRGKIGSWTAEIRTGEVLMVSDTSPAHSIQWLATGTTPQKAIDKVIKLAKHEAAKVAAAVEGL